jgi:hypothetical protein
MRPQNPLILLLCRVVHIANLNDYNNTIIMMGSVFDMYLFLAAGAGSGEMHSIEFSASVIFT